MPFEGQTLRIYNWGEYVGEHIIQDFQKETGATVLLENFDSNEQMYIKVANGEAYDILVPSDYMIQRLISEGYLQKLDKSKLNCMDKLYDAVKGLPYDPENNILFRISGEQSESCTIRQKSTSKTWKKKAITFSWIRNIKGTSTCMTQREIPL